MATTRAGLLAAVAAGVLQTGCLVQITHVSDPGPIFREARAEAERFAGRPGPAHELNVLVWDRHERELVRVSLPMWLVRRIDHEAAWHDHGAWDDEAEERFGRRIRRHVRLQDIEKAGLGILAEVEGDDGEQVLVWLR